MSAKEQLDQHVRETIAWHFSPETGCPFWLNWAKENFDPRGQINCYEDIVAKFPHFQDEWLRDLQPEIRHFAPPSPQLAPLHSRFSTRHGNGIR